MTRGIVRGRFDRSYHHSDISSVGAKSVKRSSKPSRRLAATARATGTVVLSLLLLLSIHNTLETSSLLWSPPHTIVGVGGRSTRHVLPPASPAQSLGPSSYRSWCKTESRYDSRNVNAGMLLRCYSSSDIYVVVDDDQGGITNLNGFRNPSCNTLRFKRGKLFCSSSNAFPSTALSSVLCRTERRGICRLDRMNRMLLLNAKSAIIDGDDDISKYVGNDDMESAGSSSIPSHGNTNQAETENNKDSGINSTNTSYDENNSGYTDDDQPAYRSKLRLQTPSVTEKKKNSRNRGRSSRRLPSVKGKPQKQAQQPKLSIAPSMDSTLDQLTATQKKRNRGLPYRRLPSKRRQAQKQTQQPKSSIVPPMNSSLDEPNKPKPPQPQTTPPTQSSLDLDLEYRIDSFLRGEYDLRPLLYDENTPAPHPGLTPGSTVDIALRALRELDQPEVDHGARVFLSFCAELSRNDRWGGGVSSSSSSSSSAGAGKRTGSSLWKEILRGALTPTMFARRIRASDEFSVLLDWETLDVTGGTAVNPASVERPVGVGSTVAYVNAAMFFGEGIEPQIVQFTLARRSGVWLIDTAAVSKKEWFMDDDVGDDADDDEEYEVDDEEV